MPPHIKDSIAPDPAKASKPVRTIEKPTVGRVVLVNIATFGAEPILRPAIVCATDALGNESAVTVTVFPTKDDYPLPSGLNIRAFDVGTVSSPVKTGWQIVYCKYGTTPGCWTWPVRVEPETFEV